MLFTMYAYVVLFVFGTIAFVLFSRFAFQLVRAPFVNQIVQWVYRFTNPLFRLLERVIPRWRNFSIAALVLLFLLMWLRLVVLLQPVGYTGYGPIVALSDALDFGLTYWTYAVIGYFVLGWLFTVFEARRQNDMVDLVFLLGGTPCSALRRRIRTTIGPIDFSPMIVLFVFWAANLAQRQLLLSLLPLPMP